MAFFRLMTYDDVASLLKWAPHSDPRFRHYSFDDFDLDDVGNWYFAKQRMLVRKVFGLFEGEDAVGFITLKKINLLFRTAELGLAINPALHGKGYGSEMLESFLAHVYSNFGIDEIFLDVADFNKKARGLYEKLGFMPVGERLQAYESQSNMRLAVDYPENFVLKNNRLFVDTIRMSHTRDTVGEPAHAKLNLGLRVLKTRADGYHELASTMHELELCDMVYARPSDRMGVRLLSDLEGVDASDNLVNRAAAVFATGVGASIGHDGSGANGAVNGGANGVRNGSGICVGNGSVNVAVNGAENAAIPGVDGVSMTLYKRIPMGAGLAGGSADAAATLRALNKLTKNFYSKQELLGLAAGLGADVPFCMAGGTAMATGVGEVLEPYDAEKLCFVLCPGEALSTKEVFKKYDELAQRSAGGGSKSADGLQPGGGSRREYGSQPRGGSRPEGVGSGGAVTNEDAICEMLALRDVLKKKDGAFDPHSLAAVIPPNELEAAAEALGAPIERKKRELMDAGAIYAAMTGSGSTVYGIFENMTKARWAAGRIEGALACSSRRF